MDYEAISSDYFLINFYLAIHWMLMAYNRILS